MSSFDVPVLDLDENKNDNIFIFGLAPIDPLSVVTEESKFRLKREKTEKQANVKVIKHTKSRSIMKFYFKRTEGSKSVKYWAFPTTKEEFSAVASFFKISENCIEREQEAQAVQEAQEPPKQLSLEFHPITEP